MLQLSPGSKDLGQAQPLALLQPQHHQQQLQYQVHSNLI